MIVGTKNQATQNYRELMVKVCRGMFDGTLEETIDNIPEELYPKERLPSYFNSIDVERIVCYRQLQSIVGELINSLAPPSKPLSQSLKETINRKKQDYLPGASVITEACHKCGECNIFSTNACEGCVARPCVANCPKKAVTIEDGHSVIDKDKCIGCGMCVKVCPYSAIIKKRIPCMDDCPVDAISRSSSGHSIIDPSKCIHCGRCSVRCPFGAIVMPSEVVDVISQIKKGENVIAMVAPAVLGQFSGTSVQLRAACKKCGFADMVEVALGADTTSLTESKEYFEEVAMGKQKLLATSCCPAWVRCTQVHLKGLEPFVSHTQSPMVYTGDLLKKRDPTCITVFVGPCTAKRTEALMKDNTDYVLTAMELSCIFEACEVDVSKMEGKGDPQSTRLPSMESSFYCVTQGVTQAVIHAAPKALRVIKDETGTLSDDDVTLAPIFVSPLNKTSFKKLKNWSDRKEEIPGNLLEVMCCDGGCIGGPGNVAAPLVGLNRVKKILPERPSFQDIEDVLSL
ncbi:[FeFe]-hydrogenase [Monocercomonoides exilis]|uniref:[FeFe]-hydrogenase n=1 Tax=Monocercomonoides exilis TaxID=2049356 RepID=UPI00355A73C4|nr:[FeFe]-hydrogenase [Monocercomonoides exilis]|eukprot:MONOS_1920.1-p1 / transcript=MONOS_1920.1 / gene=MONOS_1920 / organism=Monocercomonoides_exilis_PA203 / gene_product=[FeFe]-hydrogenase / transcript_product=[FeFe]-hydrogenase / location=Mono_scaffold00036:178816-180409(+) / protein_length=513 / sequence_SO=supercontig / SO=protein_coding / is_pseudo=false